MALIFWALALTLVSTLFFLLFFRYPLKLCVNVDCGFWRKNIAPAEMRINQTNRMEYNAAFLKWKSTMKGSPRNGLYKHKWKEVQKKKMKKMWKKNIDKEQSAKQNKHWIAINFDWMRYIKWINIFNAFDLCPCGVYIVHCTHYIRNRIKIIFLFSFGIWTVKMALLWLFVCFGKTFSSFRFIGLSLFSNLIDRFIFGFNGLNWIHYYFFYEQLNLAFLWIFSTFHWTQDGCVVIPRNVCKQSVPKFD